MSISRRDALRYAIGASALAGLGAATGVRAPTASAAAPTLIDYAMRQIPAQDIRAAGHAGVINYVSTSPEWRGGRIGGLGGFGMKHRVGFINDPVSNTAKTLGQLYIHDINLESCEVSAHCKDKLQHVIERYESVFSRGKTGCAFI